MSGRLTAKQRAQRSRARTFVARAVASGRLVKPALCESCGDDRPLQAHHERGYAPRHWLWVRWLCVPCHSAAKPRYLEAADEPQADLFPARAAGRRDAPFGEADHPNPYVAERRRVRFHPVHYLLLARRLTGGQLAEMASMSRVYLSKIINGHSVPSEQLARRIAACFPPEEEFSAEELLAWHRRFPPGTSWVLSDDDEAETVN